MQTAYGKRGKPCHESDESDCDCDVWR